jgi:membrane-associated phospholipid phosphatase
MDFRLFKRLVTPKGLSRSKKEQSFALPLLITPEAKSIWGIFGGLVTAVCYMLSNHFHLFEPQYLPMSWVDTAVPFLPLSVWIYASEYAFFVAVYFTLKDNLNLNRVFYAFMALQLVSGLIFVLWPTTYPRYLFPLDPQAVDTLTFNLFQSIREADSPANCCPSLHVSSVLIGALAFLNEQKSKSWFFLLWAVGIAVSTLTTKQHYLVDVLGGWGLAIAAHVFFHHKMRYQRLVLTPASLQQLGQLSEQQREARAEDKVG